MARLIAARLVGRCVELRVELSGRCAPQRLPRPARPRRVRAHEGRLLGLRVVWSLGSVGGGCVGTLEWGRYEARAQQRRRSVWSCASHSSGRAAPRSCRQSACKAGRGRGLGLGRTLAGAMVRLRGVRRRSVRCVEVGQAWPACSSDSADLEELSTAPMALAMCGALRSKAWRRCSSAESSKPSSAQCWRACASACSTAAAIAFVSARLGVTRVLPRSPYAAAAERTCRQTHAPRSGDLSDAESCSGRLCRLRPAPFHPTLRSPVTAAQSADGSPG